MNTQLVTSNVRLMQWRGMIQERTQSGLTIEEYCERKNLSRNTYYYWLRKVRDAAIKTNPDRFVELLPQEPSSEQRLLKENDTFTPAAVIQLGDARISVKDGISKECLFLLMEVIRHAE